MVKTREEASVHSPAQELNKSDCSLEVQVSYIKCSRQTLSTDRNPVLLSPSQSPGTTSQDLGDGQPDNLV